MTVSSEVSSVSYNGNGSTQVFAVPYYFLADSHLRVVLRSSGGTETAQTITTNYTVIGAGNPAGGSITMLIAPATGQSLLITRNVPVTQETDYVANDPFPAESHERALDKLTMLVQQGGFDVSRAIRVPDSDPEPSRLPAAIDRANFLLSFDTLGNPVVVAPSSGSATDLALNLANDTNPVLGASLVGYRNRTLRERLDDVRTIKSYRQPGFGVPGFGVQADDEAAFDAAIADLNSGAIKRLDVTAGTYLLNKTYTVTANGVSLFGDGVDATIIKRTNGTFGDTFVFARSNPTTQQLSGVTVSDMTFYCEADMSTGGVMRFRNCTRAFVTNVFIRNCFKGILLEGIRDSRFQNIEIIQGEFYTVDRTGAYHIQIGAPANPALKSTEIAFSNLNMTTAGNAGDVNACIRIDGAIDGAWFSNSHWFGGKIAGVIISGDTVPDISNLIFTGCFFDQFTERNLIIQGTTTDPTKFRLIRFVGCKFYGGTKSNVAIDSASGVKSVDFDSCEFGITPGVGCQIGAGQVAFNSCSFSALNQSAGANGYAIQVPGSPAAGLVLSVNSCEFECSNLTYGIWLVSTSSEYHLNGCIFRNQGGAIQAEIGFFGDTLTGTCGGHQVGRVAASEVAAGATVQNANIAVDAWNIVGIAGAVNLLKPYWHGRRLSLKAATATQTMTKTSGAGSIRNRADAATVAIPAADVYLYEYRGDTLRWHQLG